MVSFVMSDTYLLITIESTVSFLFSESPAIGPKTNGSSTNWGGIDIEGFEINPI